MSVDTSSTLPVKYFEFHMSPHKRSASEAFAQKCNFAYTAAPTMRRESFGVDVPSRTSTKENSEVGNRGGLPLESGRVQAPVGIHTFQMV
jgi:diaminopimelate decarboxylase